MNINEINNSQVTINNYTVAPDAVNGAAENTAIDEASKTRTGEVITNETTFAELVKILRKYPEAVEAERLEARARHIEEKLEEFRASLGEDGDDDLEKDEFLFLRRKEEAAANGEKFRRPGAIKLRESGVLLTQFLIDEEAKIEVFTNGYAIYDNGDRKGVIWIPGSGRVVYHFTPLRENEKLYMKEYDEISEEITAGFPWYHVLMLVGENRIEFNLAREKSKSSTSDLDDAMDYKVQASQRWTGCVRFEDPETAYLRKEAREERMAMLTERQREVYEMYFENGWSMREIAAILGINHRSVADRIDWIQARFKKNIKKVFD